MLESASPPPSLYRSLLSSLPLLFLFRAILASHEDRELAGMRLATRPLFTGRLIASSRGSLGLLRALLRGWEGDGEKRQEEQERKRAGGSKREREGGREKEIVFHYPVCLIPERFRCLYVGHRFSGSPSGPPASPDHHISPMPPCLRYLKVRHPRRARAGGNRYPFATDRNIRSVP